MGLHTFAVPPKFCAFYEDNLCAQRMCQNYKLAFATYCRRSTAPLSQERENATSLWSGSGTRVVPHRRLKVQSNKSNADDQMKVDREV
jgi:hypothetical protein